MIPFNEYQYIYASFFTYQQYQYEYLYLYHIAVYPKQKFTFRDFHDKKKPFVFWSNVKVTFNSVLNHILNYKKRLLLRCIHHFISDSINNVDHMSISGTEPSSVILRQRK